MSMVLWCQAKVPPLTQPGGKASPCPLVVITAKAYGLAPQHQGPWAHRTTSNRVGGRGRKSADLTAPQAAPIVYVALARSSWHMNGTWVAFAWAVRQSCRIHVRENLPHNPTHNNNKPTSGFRSLTLSIASSTCPVCTALRISMRSIMVDSCTPGAVPDSDSNMRAAST